MAVLRQYSDPELGPNQSSTVEKPQVRTCGDEENRTLNPRLAKAVLCQLSYVPERAGHLSNRPESIKKSTLTGPDRDTHRHPTASRWPRPTARPRRRRPAGGAARGTRRHLPPRATARSSSSAHTIQNETAT